MRVMAFSEVKNREVKNQEIENNAFMHETNVYQRKLDPIERVMLALNEIHRFNVEVIYEGVGDVDAKVLQTAVDKASAANPATRVRLRGFLGFMRWFDSGIAPQVRVINDCQWDGFNSVTSDFLDTLFAPLQGGPIADVIVLRSSSNGTSHSAAEKTKTRLVFRVLHAAIDGRGLLHWIKDIFHALNNEPLVGSAAAMEATVVMEQFSHLVKQKPQIEMSMPPLQVDYSALPQQDGEYIWRRVEVPRYSSLMIAHLALFIADYARQNSDAIAGAPHVNSNVRIRIPIDLRYSRKIAEMSVGNLTSSLDFMVDDTDTPNRIMQKIAAHLSDGLECYKSPALDIIRWLPIRFLKSLLNRIQQERYLPSKVFPTAGICSMGRIDAEQFNFTGFQCEKIIGVPSLGHRLNIVTVGQGSATQVVFLTHERFNRNGKFDHFITEFCRKFNGHSLNLEKPVEC